MTDKKANTHTYKRIDEHTDKQTDKQTDKTKRRVEEEYRSLINRLSRIEGQVRGIRKMVEHQAYCVDVLTQVSAVQSALNAFNKELLGNHIKTCVADGIRAGDDEVIDELVQIVQKLMK